MAWNTAVGLLPVSRGVVLAAGADALSSQLPGLPGSLFGVTGLSPLVEGWLAVSEQLEYRAARSPTRMMGVVGGDVLSLCLVLSLSTCTRRSKSLMRTTH